MVAEAAQAFRGNRWSGLCWIDIETTCVDELDSCAGILEVGLLRTDDHLEIVDELAVTLPRTDPTARAGWAEWSQETHAKNGLAYLTPDTAAEQMVYDFMESHWPAGSGEASRPRMAGSCLTFERKWLGARWNYLLERFHYSPGFDMRSIRRFVESLPGGVELVEYHAQRVPKLHRALADLRNNVRELRDYLRLLGWAPGEVIRG